MTRKSSNIAERRGSRAGKYGLEPAVVSVARREPVEVRKALRRARKLESDDPTVRAEVRRAVDRFDDPEIQGELRTILSRFFVEDRPPPEVERRRRHARPAATHARDRQWDVFISYATADVREARSLASELKSRGLRVFLAADTLDEEVGSTGWTAAIDDVIESSRAMLVLVTHNALASNWVAEEWRKVLPPDGRHPVRAHALFASERITYRRATPESPDVPGHRIGDRPD